MRTRRVIVPGGGCYHVISRIAGQQFLMNAEEKDVLMGLMFKAAEFSGVEILTFALMDNHFHLLVKVPAAREVDDVELVARMRVLYGDAKTDRILADWAIWERKGLAAKVADARKALRRRMFDLSQFCKTLKESYSMSYNYRHDHFGTIWGSRFKSILLSPDYRTLVTVGSYIDLNPVRAGVVEHPGRYRWSGYGTAVRGVVPSRNGLCALAATAGRKRGVPFSAALEMYEAAMEGYAGPPPEAEETPAASEESQPVQRTPAQRGTNREIGVPIGSQPAQREPAQPRRFVPEKVEAGIAGGAKLSLFELLRCRVRHFTHGLALGPASFVRGLTGTTASSRDASRRCDCCDEVELYTARWLRGDDKVSVPKHCAA